MHPVTNDFIYQLSSHSPRGTIYPMWREEDGILITPDGRRLRIESSPTVADLVHPGDTILSSYNTGGLVLRVHEHVTCCCPIDKCQNRICQPSWEGPADMSYHYELTHWTVVYAQKKAKQNKVGFFYDQADYGWINQLVATPDGRVVHLYENNDDHLIVSPDPANHAPAQLTLF